MTLRKWTLGMAMAAAAFIPLSANADPVVVNLSASPNYIPNGTIHLDFAGVTAENGNAFGNGGPVGANGGSCNSGVCAETTFGVGNVNSITDAFGNLWSSGVVSTSNPNGYDLAYIIYGIADLSVVATPAIPNTVLQTIDNTGANDPSQGNVTYNAPGGVTTTATVDIGAGQGSGAQSIHLDFYYIPKALTPCFTAQDPACGVAGQNVEVDSTDRTSFSTVDGISNAAGGGLFAQFTLQSGAKPLNTSADGTSNSLVELTQVFFPGPVFGGAADNSGHGDAYSSCATSGATTPPACSDFTPVTELTMDSKGTGYAGDPARSRAVAARSAANGRSLPSTTR